MKLTYQLNDKPPFGSALILAAQHLVAAIGGIIAAPLLLGDHLGLPQGQLVALVNASLIASGFITIIQCKGLPGVGVRLPVVMGTSFAFIGVAMSVGAQYGMSGIIGATLVGAVLMMFASRFMTTIRKMFPPAVTGTVVMLIGLSILPVAVDWLGGGKVGSPNYADGKMLLLGVFVLVVVILTAVRGKGLISASAIMIGIIVGYLLSLALGIVDFSPVMDAGVFRFPAILSFGISFNVGAIVTVALVYLVVLTEDTGNYLALGEVTKTEIKGDQLKRGILCDGLGGVFASLIGSTAPSSFSQNVGIVGLTGVASRHVVALTGGLLLIAGLFPKLGALMVTIPQPVLGGAGIVMFGMVTAAGARMMARSEDTKRSALIIAVGVSCGMAVTYRPEILQSLPAQIRMVFGTGITMGAFVAILMNLILPKERASELEPEEKPSKSASVAAKKA